MFHLLAYAASIAQTNFVDIAAISDQIITIQNGHFLPPKNMRLLAAAFLSATANRARIVSPKIRQVTTSDLIRPVNVGALPVDRHKLADFRNNPFLIMGLEELEVDGLQTSAGNEDAAAFLWLTEGLVPPPAGDVYTFRGTSTTAAVANTWTDITVTWNDILPTGRYAVVGMECQATNQRAARLILPNQFYRPGCLAIAAIGDKSDDMFMKGGLGKWGEFESTDMPRVQVFNNGTDNAHVVMLDLVRIR